MVEIIRKFEKNNLTCTSKLHLGPRASVQHLSKCKLAKISPPLIGSLGSGIVIHIKTISSTFSPPSQGAWSPGPRPIYADNKLWPAGQPCLFTLVVAINCRKHALQLSQRRQDVRLDLDSVGWDSQHTQSWGCSGQTQQRGTCHKRFPAETCLSVRTLPRYESKHGDRFCLNVGPLMRPIEHQVVSEVMRFVNLHV